MPPLTFRTVCVLTRPTRVWNVVNVTKAAEILLNEWPKDYFDSPAAVAARLACLAALEGTGSAAEVRAALIEAAREAGILGKH